MKICFLAPANNYHTKKWCKWFSEHGHEVHVVSFINDSIDGATVHFIDTGASADASDSQKIKYLLRAKAVKRIVTQINPDVVNAHYATSYGTVAALSGLKDYVLSVWGSDVYDFPQKSILHRLMLQYSLHKAGHLFSTSKAMAEEASKYTRKSFDITPFGVDCKLFSLDKARGKVSDEVDTKNGRDYVVGIVKLLSDKYGIATLLKAVAIVKNERPEIPIKLRIAGKGPQENEYKVLAKNLGISDIITWLGFISQEDAASEWANMDCAIIPSESESESFGVSAVEAEACGTAVIISDIPGLMEATRPGETSMVVKRGREDLLADAIAKLYQDREKREQLGLEGRKFVENTYEINKCFNNIYELYVKYYQ